MRHGCSIGGLCSVLRSARVRRLFVCTYRANRTKTIAIPLATFERDYSSMTGIVSLLQLTRNYCIFMRYR